MKPKNGISKKWDQNWIKEQTKPKMDHMVTLNWKLGHNLLQLAFFLIL
jgi:hypothetical protein